MEKMSEKLNMYKKNDLNTILIKEFEEARYDAQITAMQTGKNDEEKVKKMQDLYVELIQDDIAKKYFEAEMKFNILLADVNKIIGDAVKDVIQ